MHPCCGLKCASSQFTPENYRKPFCLNEFIWPSLNGRYAPLSYIHIDALRDHSSIVSKPSTSSITTSSSAAQIVVLALDMSYSAPFQPSF